MDTLHQLWIGGAMPEQNERWCASMHTLAARLGMGYRLDTWETVAARYAANRVIAILQAALRTLPTATTYSLISDWYRVRILADEGGWYADTDYEAVDVPQWTPSADLAFFNELGKHERLATGITVCNGTRGMEACRILADGVEEKLLATLPDPQSGDWCQRYIETVRSDKPGKSMYLINYIGPRYVRSLFPALRTAGYTWEAIPRQAACNWRKRNYLSGGKSCIWHYGTGTWIKKDFDWDAQLEAAKKMDAAHAGEQTRAQPRRNRRGGAPPHHQHPLGLAALPPPRRHTHGAQDSQPAPPAARRTDTPPPVFRVPGGTKRIVVFSNVTEGFPEFRLQAGDWCIHCNTARHLEEASLVPGTTHALLVRHSVDKVSQRRIWNIPASMRGAEQVEFLNPGCGIGKYPWYKAYKKARPRQSPTTGFIAANLARSLRPGLPLFLVGFDPGERHGTPVADCHAWDYERQWYYEQGFTLLHPKTTCKILAGILSCHAMPGRRAACRETWIKDSPRDTRCVFFAGRPPGGTPPPYEPGLVQVESGDGYQDAPQKEAAFFRHALRDYNFEWLYLCDDDTYTRLDRLPQLIGEVSRISPMPGLAGNYGCSSGYLCGGAGMLLHRTTVEALVQHPEAWPDTTWGDVALQQACANLGIPVHISPRLNASPTPTPAQDPHLITAHWLSPQAMRAIKP